MYSERTRLKETKVSGLYNHTFGTDLTTPSQLKFHWIEYKVPRFPDKAETNYVSLRPHDDPMVI